VRRITEPPDGPNVPPEQLALSKFGSQVTTTVGVNLAQTVLLSAMFDASSQFGRLPKDVVRDHILCYYVPSANHRYLLYKPLSRSYYQICRMISRREKPCEVTYQLSTAVVCIHSLRNFE
jgi:hypothetical protein